MSNQTVTLKENAYYFVFQPNGRKAIRECADRDIPGCQLLGKRPGQWMIKAKLPNGKIIETETCFLLAK